MKVFEINIPLELGVLYFQSNFNPSIIKLDSEHYLFSFRTFSRYGPKEYTSKVNNINHPNHPWYGGPDSETYWHPGDNGFTGTYFLILRIINTIDIVTLLPNYIENAVDGRLFILPNDQIVMTSTELYPYRDIGTDRDKYRLGSTNRCQELCELIGMYSIKLLRHRDKWGNINRDLGPICENLATNSDRNWSLWNYNKSIYISYWLTPKHIIFNLPEIGEKCTSRKSSSITLLEKISNYYHKSLIFSLSTPSYPFNHGLYLGVGHVKIYVDELDDMKQSNVGQFIDLIKTINIPPHVLNIYYLMFLYTFNPITLDIINISHAFYPPTTEYGVVFPCGLTKYNEDTYIISYGEADYRMKLLFIEKSEMVAMLTTYITPDTYNFQLIR